MKKILIVDDRKENRTMLANYFKLFGSSEQMIILQADNSSVAVELALGEKPDLILMDIKLETDEAGLDAARRIKANDETKEIPIWAVTAYPQLDSNDSADGFNAIGFSYLINKPFDPMALIKNISATLNVPIPDEIKQRMGI